MEVTFFFQFCADAGCPRRGRTHAHTQTHTHTQARTNTHKHTHTLTHIHTLTHTEAVHVEVEQNRMCVSTKRTYASHVCLRVCCAVLCCDVLCSAHERTHLQAFSLQGACIWATTWVRSSTGFDYRRSTPNRTTLTQLPSLATPPLLSLILLLLLLHLPLLLLPRLPVPVCSSASWICTPSQSRSAPDNSRAIATPSQRR